MATDSNGRRKKRRTCADRMLRNVGWRRRRNPTGKAVVRLLGLLSAALALFPDNAEAFRAPGRRNNSRPARRTPPADYELGTEAWARERGIEPSVYPVSKPKPRPSWDRLVKDLNRRSAQDRARVMIEERVPAEALDWLLDAIQKEDWLALRMVGHDRTEEGIRERVSLAAKAWKEERRMTALETTTTDDDAGAAAPPAGPKQSL